MKQKKSVVFGGGGARGSYELGVWKAILEQNYKIDLAVGTSVGSLNACLMAQGSYEKAFETWLEIDTTGIFDIDLNIDLENIEELRASTFQMLKQAVKQGGLPYDSLRKLLNERVKENEVRNSPIRFGLQTTKLKGLKSEKRYIENIPMGLLNDYLLASCACFPAMQPYVINSRAYIDGGYSDNVPIQMAIDGSAKDIIAVDLKSPGLLGGYKLSKNQRVTRINRLWDLGYLFLFDQRRIYRNSQLGYMEAMKAFQKLDGYRYTFEHHTFSEMLKGEIGGKLKALFYELHLYGVLFPKIHSLSVNELRMLNTVESSIKKEFTSEEQLEMILLFSAEYLADLYLLSPMPIYQLEQFILALQFNMEHPDLSQNIQSALASDANLLPQMPAISIVDSRKKVAQLFSILEKKEKSVGDKNLLMREVLLYPSEFLGAVFLFLFDINMD